MLNKAMLIGRLGKEPEMKYTPQGNAVTTLSIATERKWRDASGAIKKETDWHTVVCWNELAETANAYLTTGRLVYVEGYLKTEKWGEGQERRQRTIIVAEMIRYLERKAPEERRYMEEVSLPDDLGNHERHEAAALRRGLGIEFRRTRDNAVIFQLVTNGTETDDVPF